MHSLHWMRLELVSVAERGGGGGEPFSLLLAGSEWGVLQLVCWKWGLDY